MLYRWLFALSVIASAGRAGPQEQFQVERRTVGEGAELLTVFGKMPETPGSTTASTVPLLAMLRDTQRGESRLRYVWVLTSPRPTSLQRITAAVPFFYWRTGSDRNIGRAPKPVLDLGAASSRVWTSLGGSLVQVMALDETGTFLRSSTRSYRNNSRDQGQIQLLEALAVVSQLEQLPESESHLSESELLALHARLNLAAQTLGGLVGESKLSEAYQKLRARTTMERGHNWELLRQRAEANGLYFEPFGLNGSATLAVLWIAKDELDSAHSFDGRFLEISNPYRDERLQGWKGYTAWREGRELIPLALYSLEHPKVPLLLADFRNTSAPRRREMTRHAAVDLLSGVIGFSRWEAWPVFTASWAWDFVRSRHGTANNRRDRIRAYAQARQSLALDLTLEPQLREELLDHLDALGVNPLDERIVAKARLARRQYDALLRYADDPKGLSRKVTAKRESGRGTVHAVQ